VRLIPTDAPVRSFDSISIFRGRTASISLPTASHFRFPSSSLLGRSSNQPIGGVLHRPVELARLIGSCVALRGIRTGISEFYNKVQSCGDSSSVSAPGLFLVGWTGKIRTLNPIRIEDIGQDDDSYQTVNVRPTDNGQHIKLRCTHAFKR